MPRFPEESVACLKRVMLSRALEEFRFIQNDVDVICAETGLNQAQVQVWAENFRMRYVTVNERLEFLRFEGLSKVT